MNKPLFYRQVVPVDKNRHRDASIAPVTDMTFAAATNSVIILAAEFSKACREYPLVFVADQGNYFPAAVLGLQDGQNLFISTQGAWKATYIPAYVRRYPFIPALQEGSTDYLVCIDEGFAGFNREGRGEQLFVEEGVQSAALARSLSFLQEFQIQHQRTLDFCKVMQQHDLMEPMQADVAMASGKKLQLNGFFVVSRQKMAALTDEVLASLYRQGYLELAFAHLLSLDNFERLVALEGEKGVV